MLLSQAWLCLGKQPLSQYQMRHTYLDIKLNLLHTFGKKKPQMSHLIIMEIFNVKQQTINKLTQEIRQVPRCLRLLLYIEGVCANRPLPFLEIQSQLLVLFFCISLSTSEDSLLFYRKPLLSVWKVSRTSHIEVDSFTFLSWFLSLFFKNSGLLFCFVLFHTDSTATPEMSKLVLTDKHLFYFICFSTISYSSSFKS